MDNRAQYAITLVLCLLSLIGWGQCSDSIKVIKENGCKRYSISQGLMVDLFVAKRSLDTTHAYIGIIQSKLDSVLIKDQIIEANLKRSDSLLEARERTRQEKDSICAYTVMRHKQVLSDVVKEAEQVNMRYQKEKSNRWKWGGGGAFLVIVIEVLAFIAF